MFAPDGDLFIADQLGGTPRALVAGPDVDSDPVFSPQGDRIAFVRGPDATRVMMVNPDGLDVRELSWDSGVVRRLDWSPDGSALLVSSYDRDVWEQTQVVRSDGSGFQTLGVGHTFFAIDAWWRSDGRHIAIKGDLNTPDDGLVRGLYLADADGNLRRLPVGSAAELGGLEWSPDGKHLAFGSAGFQDGDFGVSIADIDEDGELTALRRLRLDPESYKEASPKWSPDGSQLAVMQTNGSREQIGVVDADGSGFRIVWPDVTHLGSSDEYFWSPDGRSLVITEVITEEDPDSGQFVRRAGRTWILDVASGQQAEVDPPVQSWQRLAP